jgi:hypothetical protein
VEEEGPLVRLLIDDHVRGHACTVAGLHLHAYQHGRVALLRGLQGADELEAVRDIADNTV